MRVTLKDVAREAGCNCMAVSRVINGKQLNHVSPALQARIRRAARKLNYQSNQAARALRTGRTWSIGLVIGKISGHTQACCAHALLNEVKKYNYKLNIEITNYAPEEEEKALENLVNLQNEGVIYHVGLNPESAIARRLHEMNFPLLLTSGRGNLFNTLSVNWRGGIREAFRVFHEHGHDRVGIITSESNYQRPFYEELAAEYGITVTPFLHVPLRSSIRESIVKFLKSGIPAVFTLSNDIIQNLLAYLREQSIAFRPDFIYPYTLPFDYILPDSGCLGALVDPFRERIELQVARMIEMIEKSDGARRDIILDGYFLTPEKVREYYLRQCADTYYDVF